MRRIRFLTLMALPAFCLSGWSQVYYEQWIDGNRNTVKRGQMVLGEQTLSVDVSAVPWAGLHFLNIVPYDASGEPGVWKQIPFVMPEAWPKTAEGAWMEYWVTGYGSKPTLKTYQSGEVTLSIDAKSFSPGMHFLNFRTMNSVGERGPWKVMAFVMPEGWPQTNDATRMEYWLTAYGTKPTTKSYTSGDVAFSIDVSALSPGMHFLNFRTMNAAGERGPWKVLAFMMPEAWPGTNDGQTLEYWVTAYDTKPTRKKFDTGEITFDIDVSKMTYGLHFLNVRSQNARGEYGPWKQIPFYLANGQWDGEEMEFDYWIDSDAPLTGKGYMPGTIPLSIDIRALSEGKHTFNFKGKNMFGTYGELFTTTFSTEPAATDIDTPADTSQRLTVRARRGMLVFESSCRRHVTIHTAAGQLVRRLHLQEGQTIADGLAPGVYIVEGMKMNVE